MDPLPIFASERLYLAEKSPFARLGPNRCQPASRLTVAVLAWANFLFNFLPTCRFDTSYHHGGQTIPLRLLFHYNGKRAASDAVYQLCRKLDMPSTLREVGVPEEGLEFIASATLHDRSLATHPKPVSDAGPIMSVLREAW